MELLLQHPELLVTFIVQVVAFVWWLAKLNGKIESCVRELGQIAQHDGRIKLIELSFASIMAKLEMLQQMIKEERHNGRREN